VLEPDRAVRVVLHGLEGTLTLGGDTYMNRMPPLGARLSDPEIAAILTYVRGSWGNRAGAVTPETVARVRAETEGRDRPYRVEELPGEAAPGERP
jgi:mono/diheme cytochrome c family protein